MMSLVAYGVASVAVLVGLVGLSSRMHTDPHPVSSTSEPLDESTTITHMGRLLPSFYSEARCWDALNDPEVVGSNEIDQPAAKLALSNCALALGRYDEAIRHAQAAQSRRLSISPGLLRLRFEARMTEEYARSLKRRRGAPSPTSAERELLN